MTFPHKATASFPTNSVVTIGQTAAPFPQTNRSTFPHKNSTVHTKKQCCAYTEQRLVPQTTSTLHRKHVLCTLCKHMQQAFILTLLACFIHANYKMCTALLACSCVCLDLATIWIKGRRRTANKPCERHTEHTALSTHSISGQKTNRHAPQRTQAASISFGMRRRPDHSVLSNLIQISFGCNGDLCCLKSFLVLLVNPHCCLKLEINQKSQRTRVAPQPMKDCCGSLVAAQKQKLWMWKGYVSVW